MSGSIPIPSNIPQSPSQEPLDTTDAPTVSPEPGETPAPPTETSAMTLDIPAIGLLTAGEAKAAYDAWLDEHANLSSYTLSGQTAEVYEYYGEQYYLFHTEDTLTYWYNILVHPDTGELLIMVTSDGEESETEIEPLDNWYNRYFSAIQVFDPSDLGVYGPIVNAYAALEMSGYTDIDEGLIGDSLLAVQQWGTYNFGYDELPELVYAIHDINDDGSPELIIGVDSYGVTVSGIYVTNNDQPESLIQVEDRYALTLTTDVDGETVIILAWGHMGVATEFFYRLIDAGLEYPMSYLGTLDIIHTEEPERYRVSYSGEEDDVLITEEEYIALLQRLNYHGYSHSGDVEFRPLLLDWMPILDR